MKQFKNEIDLREKDEYLYILKNGDEYYIGQTKNLGRRLTQHQYSGFNFTHYSAAKVFCGVLAERKLILDLCTVLNNWPSKYLDSYCIPEYDLKDYFLYRKYEYGEPKCDTWRHYKERFEDADIGINALDSELYTIHWNKAKNSAFSRFNYKKDPLNHEYQRGKQDFIMPFKKFSKWHYDQNWNNYIPTSEEIFYYHKGYPIFGWKPDPDFKGHISEITGVYETTDELRSIYETL